MLLSRFVAALPLLYVGAALIVDPDGLVESLHHLTRVIAEFSQRLQGHHVGNYVPASPAAGSKRTLRVCGVALVVLGLLLIAAP